jgi:hypothetical protein
MTFDTKIAIVVREDLLTWQKLNVTAFLTSGVMGEGGAAVGEPYRDAAGNLYAPLIVQPVIVLAADRETLASILRRGLDRGLRMALYIDEMFSTCHDEANRAAVAAALPEATNLAGLSLRAERRLVDKVTRGARMHP